MDAVTPNRYTELPVNVAPDVPHHVNIALREIGKDMALQILRLSGTADLAKGTAAGLDTVQEELATGGIMRGHASTPENTGSAWRQTTEDGHLLPLGYDASGHLDEFARKIWREDVNHTEAVGRHPTYARATVTEDNTLLWGLTWEGKVVIPGLEIPAGIAPAAQLYNDAPYTPGSDVLPAHANTAQWAGWGSSSMFLMHGEFSALAQAQGAQFHAGGKPSEKSYHIAARLGSVPARLTFPGNTVPGGGQVTVTSGNIDHLDLLTYSGYVTDQAGNRVPGQLGSINNALTFTRTNNGQPASVAADAAFIPDAGHRHRDAVTLLWMGKNNAWEAPERVIADTDASFDFLAPLVKRCLVLGHFNNTGGDDRTRKNLDIIHEAHRRRYGAAFVDVGAYLTGEQVWKDAGITPTAEDLAQQRLGNKPPSLSQDVGHMNAAANKAVLGLVEQRMSALGWHK